MITSLYAGLLALIYFRISLDAINARRKHQISLGPGKENEIEQIVSAHSNYSAYTPILIILLFGAEFQPELPRELIHIFGVLITAGRTLHYLAFKNKMNFLYRKWGMYLTLWPILILGLLNIILFII